MKFDFLGVSENLDFTMFWGCEKWWFFEGQNGGKKVSNFVVSGGFRVKKVTFFELKKSVFSS